MKPRCSFACLALGAFVVSAWSGAGAQSSQTPTFRAGVDVVQLDVSVLDEHRQPVTGLRAEDFTIVVRDVPQPIVSFTEIALPPRPVDGAAWLREVAPDVSTNFLNAQRIVVILLDDCNVPFDPMFATLARRIADGTIAQLGPADLAAVVFTGSRRQGQEFTTDRARLREAVARFTPLGVGGAEPHQFSASRTASGGLPLGGGRVPSAQCFRAVPQALDAAASALRDYPGWRKTLAFISPYSPTFAPDAIETTDDLAVWGEVFDAMQEANLTLYQFDPRGLEVGAGIAQDLGTLADATGGRTVKATNAPEAGVPQMFRENSAYYMLGFQPTDPVQNGRFRAVDVRVNRPGVTVRTRSGYYAPRAASAPRPSNRPEPSVLDRAVSGSLPSGDLPMTLTVAPFARPGASRAAVAVVAGFTQIGTGNGRDQYDVLVRAFRDNWKEAGTVTQRIEVATRPTSIGPLHVDLVSRLDLPPGRYEIRTAATSVVTGATGSAYGSVVVPDFRRDELSLSGVVLARQSSALTGETVALRDVVPVRPTTLREFASNEGVRAFVRVSQGERRSPVDITLTTRLVDARDDVRFSREMTLEAAQFSRERSADVTLDLPLNTLPAGEYLLSIEAAAGGRAARRDVRMTIRP